MNKVSNYNKNIVLITVLEEERKHKKKREIVFFAYPQCYGLVKGKKYPDNLRDVTEQIGSPPN